MPWDHAAGWLLHQEAIKGALRVLGGVAGNLVCLPPRHLFNVEVLLLLGSLSSLPSLISCKPFAASQCHYVSGSPGETSPMA